MRGERARIEGTIMRARDSPRIGVGETLMKARQVRLAVGGRRFKIPIESHTSVEYRRDEMLALDISV